MYYLGLISLSFMSIIVRSYEACTDIDLPDEIEFNESVPQGSVLFTSNVTDSLVDSQWTNLNQQSGIKLEKNANSSQYELILTKEVNLDERDLTGACKTPLKYNFTYQCTDNGKTKQKSVVFKILPVDNIPAFFRQTKWRSLNILENETVGYEFIDLNNTFIDTDCYTTHSFSLYPHVSASPDVVNHFNLNSSRLILKKQFDADELKCEPGSRLMKNVTVKLWEADYRMVKKEKASATITVTVIDVDDQVPMFVNPGCNKTCKPCIVDSYHHSLTTEDIGPAIMTVQAIDTDTPKSNITYKIQRVMSEEYSDMFLLDKSTGQLRLTKSFGEKLNGTGITDNFTVTITIQATEINTGQMSKNINITIQVLVPATTTTTSTTTSTTTTTTPSTNTPVTSTPESTTVESSESATSDKVKDTLIIVLPIVAGFIVLILIIILVRQRRQRQKRTRTFKLKHGNVNGLHKPDMENKGTEHGGLEVEKKENDGKIVVSYANVESGKYSIDIENPF